MRRPGSGHAVRSVMSEPRYMIASEHLDSHSRRRGGAMNRGVGQVSRGHSSMPRAPRRSHTVRRSGQTRPASMRPMVETETPEASASCCWLSWVPERLPRMAMASWATCATASRSPGEMSRRHGPTGQRPRGASRSRGAGAGTDLTFAQRDGRITATTAHSVTDDLSAVKSGFWGLSLARRATARRICGRTVLGVHGAARDGGAAGPIKEGTP